MAAIINKNVTLAANITGLVDVDHEYNPESENPISGKGVAQALAGFEGGNGSVEIPENVETIDNKVTTIDENSTDIQYPTAKAVYDLIGGIGNTGGSSGGTSDSVTSNVICTFLDAYVAWKNGEAFPIAFIGDSTFAGTGSGADKAFPVVLQEMLRAECGESATVYNVSVAGSGLGNAINSFESNFGENGTYADTKIICIGYGINDRLGHSSYKGYKNKVYADVENLVNKCFEKGIQPVIVTSQATSECGVATNYTQYPMRSASAINICANGAKKDVAEKYNIPLIDLNHFTELYMTNSKEDVDVIIPDRLHFSAIGNKYEAGLMFKYFVPRTITYSGNNDKIISLSNQNIVCAIPENKISYGGDYKVYVDYEKSDNEDTKIIDTYLFVEDYPILLNVIKNNDASSTYVKVDGVNYSIDGTESYICELDLGLHHLEVYTGTNTIVDFCAFIINATGIGTKQVAVTGIALDTTELTVENTKIGTIVATVLPGDATNKRVIWTTDNESICSVKNGVVTGKGVGSCVVTATTVDGGFSATCTITVTPVELAVDSKDVNATTQSVASQYNLLFLPGLDSTNHTCTLSNKTIKSIELNFGGAGTFGIGKVNLKDLSNKTVTTANDIKEYTVSNSGFVVVDIEDIVLGENETIAITAHTMAITLFTSESNKICPVSVGDGSKLNYISNSMYSMQGRIVYE